MEDTTLLDELQAQLQAALSHLYDPLFAPGADLCAALNVPADEGRDTLRQVLLDAIASLRPATETPHTTEAYRVYQVLTLRYAQHLTQVQTAERLSITSRHLRREQRHAVRVLAAALLEQAKQEVASDSLPEAPPADWEAQARQEVAVLERQAPAATADLRKSFESVLALTRHVTEVRGVTVPTPALPGNLAIALHPTLLRQLLLMAVTSLASQVSPGGEIRVLAQPTASALSLRFLPHGLLPGAEMSPDAIGQMVSLTGASKVRVAWEGGALRLDLPLACELHVLVIDDNDDLVHVFRRYTNGTAFAVDHVKTEPDALEAIALHPPAVIILDIMLPETDGWELLVHLHEHPVARHIPVIVCSVVREWDLALALGAQAYLAKPVRSREFIEALVAAVASSTTESSQMPAPSSTDCAA